MGMFDDLRCARIMPDGYEGGEFQTKDLSCYFDAYEITPEGRLVQANDGRRDLHFHGYLNFYTYTRDDKWHEYNAKFTDGALVEIRCAEFRQTVPTPTGDSTPLPEASSEDSP